MTLGTSETNSRKCTARNETGAQAPKLKGVNKMAKPMTYCIIHKPNKADRGKYHSPSMEILRVHHGYYLEAKRILEELELKMYSDGKGKLIDKRERGKFSIIVAKSCTGDSLKATWLLTEKEKEIEMQEKYGEFIAIRQMNPHRTQ